MFSKNAMLSVPATTSVPFHTWWSATCRLAKTARTSCSPTIRPSHLILQIFPGGPNSWKTAAWSWALVWLPWRCSASSFWARPSMDGVAGDHFLNILVRLRSTRVNPTIRALWPKALDLNLSFNSFWKQGTNICLLLFFNRQLTSAFPCPF